MMPDGDDPELSALYTDLMYRNIVPLDAGSLIADVPMNSTGFPRSTRATYQRSG